MEWIISLGILGLICIGLEVFVPGGVLGSLGGLCIIVSLVFAYLRFSFPGFLICVVFLIFTAFLVYYIALKLVPRTKFGSSIFLRTSQKGYDVLEKEYEDFIGKEGIAVSYLRPTGIVEVNDRRLNAITEGDFLEKGTKIKVTGIRSNQLVVDKID